jgi:hypothetical protein
VEVEEKARRGRRHGFALSVLLAAFVIRVGIQLWQSVSPTEALPPFEAWQSGTIPYWALLISQVVIIAVSLWVIAGLLRGTMKVNVTAGRIITWIGVAYFIFAVGRFVAGFTVAKDVPFLDDHLPGFFHIVLASMVLIAGDFFRGGERLIPPKAVKQ